MKNWKKGTKLNKEQYVIESMLLKATGGIAYKALDLKNNHSVTLKTIGDSNNPISEEETQQIIKLAECQHPNLLRLEPQVFQEDNQAYLVMEFIQGEDLASYLDHNGKLTDQEGLNIISRIGSALNVLHKNGFIHKEIKPQNIMLREDDGQPVLNDFGLSLELFSIRQKRMTKNLMDSFTPLEVYTNPEQIGIHTDIYSLASTLYVLLTSQLPTPTNARQYNPLIPPKQLNPDITEQLNDAILKGMELNPGARPQNMKQWFKLLESSAKANPSKKSTNSLKPKSAAQIQSFEYETFTLEPQEQFFGLMTKLNKNIVNKTGKYFPEKLKDDIQLEMIYISNGSFQMGSANSEPERAKDEGPQHRVKINSFYMSKYPITQLQWQIVAEFPKVNRELNPNPSNFKGENLPVEKVSWYDATEFCDRLSKFTNRAYRIPTEAEWEYACRGGTKTPFYFGNIITTDFANYDGKTGYGSKPTGKQLKKTTPVDSFPPNPYGLCDLHGNVWEWCEDHYSNSYQNKPSDGSAYYSTMQNLPRTVRGGSWSLTPDYCRSAKRTSYAPDSQYNFVGFRVVCVL